MLNYRTTSLPDTIKNGIALSEDARLRNLIVVTEVYDCEAFSFYLSNKCKLDLMLFIVFNPFLLQPVN